MPRSSRHKLHKSRRRESDYSDSEEVDVKKVKNYRNDEKEVVSRVSRDSRSGEKRKLASQSVNGEEQSDYGNGDERKRRVDVEGGDGVVVVEKAARKESSRRNDSERSSKTESKSKSKASSDSKSRSSRRNEIDGQRTEESVDDVKEKEKVRKNKRDDKRDSEMRESSREGRDVKRGMENTEDPSQDELRNPQLEKELVKQNKKRRQGSVEKDKYQDDEKVSYDIELSSRVEHAKERRYKDGRFNVGSYRDKYREDVGRENRHGDGKRREDDRERRYPEDKHRDEGALRDCLSNKSDAKPTRGESNGAESYSKKSKILDRNHDGSPICEDRSTRHKDDKRKRSNEEYQTDVRSRSIMEEHSDVQKKSITCRKVEIVADRGRTRSQHADMDSNTTHNKWSSPGSISHIAKDQFGLLKQEESKYRDSVSKESVCRDAVSPKEISGFSGAPEKASVSWPTEKHLNKDDGHLDELPRERCQNYDAHNSPMHLLENSTSSKSAEYVTRAGGRRCLDVEEIVQKSSGGTRIAKNVVSNEVKAIRELSTSPSSRTSDLRSNSRSLFRPPPHFRSVVNSTSKFGSSEEGSRGKSNNHFKRTGDFNMGRERGNAGAPNWSSAGTNSFIPFHHGPPPVGFHPMMQQFSAPPIFGVRPSIGYNHRGVPYYISDTDRFYSHGHPFGWQKPLDDSHLPHLQRWDAKNGGLEGEFHIFGPLDQDHNKNMMSSQGWETSIDTRKGNGSLTTELPSVLQKEDHSVHSPAEEIWAGESSQLLDEQTQIYLQAENIDSGWSTDFSAKKTSETPQSITEKSLTKTSRDDDAHLQHVYLSKLDISTDLTYPELYSQCMSLMNEQNRVVDEDATKPLYLEVVEARVKISGNTSNYSLFAAISDSVFQRAMCFYKKQKEDTSAIFLPSVSNGEKGQLVPAFHGQDVGDVIPSSNQEKPEMSASSLKPEMPMPHATPYERPDKPYPANRLGSQEEPFPSLHAVEMNVDKVVGQETSNVRTFDDKFSTVEKVSKFVSLASGYIEDLNETEEHKLVDIKCGPLPFPDVPSESGLVNLSRILHSPESTH